MPRISAKYDRSARSAGSSVSRSIAAIASANFPSCIAETTDAGSTGAAGAIARFDPMGDGASAPKTIAMAGMKTIPRWRVARPRLYLTVDRSS